MNTAFNFDLIAKVNQAFNPSTPISSLSLFSGRSDQMSRLLGSCFQPGQHVVLYGERGVGKTSLARIILEALQKAGVTIMKSGTVNCDLTDDFSSIWHKALRQVLVKVPKISTVGFQDPSAPAEMTEACLDDALPEVVTPDDVRGVLSALKTAAVIVIDELDRLQNKAAKTLLADTIKTLSDHITPVTLVLIGVAASVNELVAEHHSIDRALVQIHMPRMSTEELLGIIEKGEELSGMVFHDSAKQTIVGLSKGLPHYTHLLALNSAMRAMVRGMEVTEDDIRAALDAVVKNKTTVSSAYEHAVSSSHKDSLHEKVLVACGMCQTDQDGYFTSPEVAEQLSKLTGKDCAVSVFSRHLNEFCTTKRGPVLARTGTERRYRYRFVDPLMQPFATIQAITKGIVESKTIREMIQLTFDL